MDYPICVRGSIHLQLFSLKGIVFHSLLLRIEMKESFSYCTAGNRNGPNGCLFVRNFHHCYKKDQEIFVCRMV